MQASYSELIDDHDHIARCADRLLNEAGKQDARPEALVRQMHELGVFVRDHVATEEAVIALCDAKPLPTPWRRTFIEGRDRFAELRCDWLTFLAEWPADVIAYDLDGYREDATRILGRVKERVAAEKEGLYAVALQAGAISFR